MAVRCRARLTEYVEEADLEEAVRSLLHKSRGAWVYVARALVELQVTPWRDLPALPEGGLEKENSLSPELVHTMEAHAVGPMYAVQVERVKTQGRVPAEVMHHALLILSAVRESMAVEDLERWLPGCPDIHEVLHQLGSLFSQQMVEGIRVMVPSHKSLVDW